MSLNINWDSAIQLGFYYGLYVDLINSLMIYIIIGLLNLRAAKLSVLFFLVIWLFHLGDTLYLKFFGSHIELWILKYHLKDIFAVKSEIIQLFKYIFILASSGFFIITLFLIPHIQLSLSLRNNFIILIVLVSAHSIPSKIGFQNYNHLILSDNIFKTLFFSNLRGIGSNPNEVIVKNLNSFLIENTVQNIREGLKYQFNVNKDDNHKLLNKFGFKTDDKINIILLFVESFRYFEYGHKEIGPKLFPKLKSQIKKYGIEFTNAYSSSFTASPTSKGQFSTLCSNYGDIRGPSTYQANPNSNVTCLAQVLKNLNYKTIWMNSYHKNFHNSFVFESLHGTEYFFDQEFYLQKGLNTFIGEFGLADDDFLQASLSELTRSKTASPFFANLLTSSSHAPFHVLKGFEFISPIGDDGSQQSSSKNEYLGYLSLFSYLDFSLSHFIENLFNSSIGENTLLIIVADHGTLIPPNFKLTQIQTQELSFRIPIFLLSKYRKKYEKIDHQVHQIDIAPFIGELLNVNQKVTWQGNSLFKNGSPWFITNNLGFSMRAHNKACYFIGNNLLKTCYNLNVKGKSLDPLYDNLTSETLELTNDINKFSKFIELNAEALTKNLFDQ